VKTMLARFEIVWEIPLAVLSFLFYKIVRLLVHQVVQAQAIVNKKQAGRWRVLDARSLRAPLNLLALMTSAPRWNTHAIIAVAGPFKVQRSCKLCAASAARSATSWTVVAHASPGHRMVASVGSLGAPHQEPWQAMPLEPGRYRLALRYYHWSEHVELPAVEVDGVEVIPATALEAHTNDFYHDLIRRNNFFYLCLHYYVGVLLRYQQWLPQSFVKREYLPAGNPQTEFYYGFLRANESLVFALHPQLLQTHDVYLTLYNRASFPLLWYPLREGEHTTPPSPSDGSYLVRIHQKVTSQEPFDHDWVQIRVSS